MIGKEIVRFHCVYWPAFLLAAGLPLPTQIVAHGWLLFEESKMSKSRGNIVRSETIREVLGADALRYFLFREIVFGQDGSFSFDALVQRFNSDLANGLGNLASRTLSMIQRYFAGEVPYPSATFAHTPAETAIATIATETIATYNRLFESFQFSRALETLWLLLSAVDKYIVETQPWAVAEKSRTAMPAPASPPFSTPRPRLCASSPCWPTPSFRNPPQRSFTQLGLGDVAQSDLNTLRWGQLNVGTRLGRIEAVFPRADKSAIERMQQMEEDRRSAAEPAAATSTATAVAEPPATQPGAPHLPQSADVGTVTETLAGPTPPAVGECGNQTATGGERLRRPSRAAGRRPPAVAHIPSMISLKVDSAFGTVLTAEKVEKADKLLRLTVGHRHRSPPDRRRNRQDLRSRDARRRARSSIVANLAPRKLAASSRKA